MKKIFTLKFVLPVLFFGMTILNGFGQSLTEDFSYTTGTLLTANGYTSISGTGTNNLTVTTPGLLYTGSPSSGVGNAVTMTTNGDDNTRLFAPTINSGNAYASFLINVTSAQATGDYFFSLYDGTFITRVFAKVSGAGYVLGVSKGAGTVSYDATVRSFNIVNLVVLKYAFNSVSTTDDLVSLYINPTLGNTEPSATIAPTGSGTTDAGTFNRIALRQGSGTAASAQIIDAIRVGSTWASVTPVLTPTTTSISPTSANAGDGGFTLTVNGTNFINNNSTVTWNGANRNTSFVNATQITAAIPATDLATAGTATVGVTTGAAALSNSQTFTINPVSGPAIILTSALPGFGNICTNTTAGPNSFTLDGNSLDGTNISLAALSGFTYSETSAGTYTSTLNFSYAGSSFSGKIIYVIFSPAVVQSYNGNITLNGGGVVNYPVASTGAGVNSAPSVTTSISSSVAATSATASGAISATGCTGITAYGIEYSTASGFPDGSGTQVLSSNLSGGNFSSSLTGLLPNTRYYYKAFATNNAGTSYGTQLAFTCTPLPVPMAAQSGLSYTQNFTDIATWGSFFTSGNGANHFGGLTANATGTIPDGIKITASTANFQGPAFGSIGGVQRGTDQVPATQSIVLLSTGGTDFSSAAALDFYIDFTGVNAGTLSFDWASVNNSSGDRNGSMRVYTSTDGIAFTELTFAAVLNFTNNSLTSGNKVNIALPASFNNSPAARLRFYYYNATGGITPTGSRPKISIDNLNVTAVATTPCTSPAAPATNLIFGTINDVSIQASFTAASPATDNYLVIMSTSNSLTGNPVDGQIYALGDNVGDGSVVAKGSATSFTATGLTALTTYYFFVFPVNAVCTGGPLYYTSTVLKGSATTAAGLPPCTAPASQPTNLIFGSTGTNTIQGSFTGTAADGYLVVRSTDAALTGNPVNAQAYNTGDVFANAVVVQRSSATSFTANSLIPNTAYYFFIFSLNSQNCINGPVYNTASPLSGTLTTQPLPPCATPSAQPTNLFLTVSNTAVSGTFAGVTNTDDYLVVRSVSPTLSATPVDNTDYNAGDILGGGTVVANSSNTGFLANNLTANTTYYFFVFAANKNCSGGTKYFAANPLTANITTTNAVTNSYYFGTLHSHSDYSDGNKDNPGFTPADDYLYAMTANCLDYLGISEHNHFSTVDNPGNQVGNYHQGSIQANNFTSTHPNFLALYGMEWGVISGGGHVVIYGDGMDDLFGWETGAGVWGPSNNYDVYVPKSTYLGSTGLFKTVNDYIGKNTFATLAHPNLTDFNNIAGIAYDAVADNAIVGSAIESGPAFSANTSYTDPGNFNLGVYLAYFQTLLAKGYHLGPTIDHDNHNTTFGHTTSSRTAIIAPSLTKTTIVKAMRDMHFYATQDCDSKVDFTINTQIMGSSITDRYAPIIYVTLTDPTPSAFPDTIRVMFGTPGSGTLAVKIDSAIGNSLQFTDNNLPNLATGYYYIDISNGSSRIVTSPIWYSRVDVSAPLPVKLSSFMVQKSDNAVKINWSTEQESNSRNFIVEHSTDGRNWTGIATINAAGNSSHRIDYLAFDNAPANGINYYRLKQVDKDEKFEYSVVRSVLFSKVYEVRITPNPASSFVNIYIAKKTSVITQIIITDANANVVEKYNTPDQTKQINIGKYAKGVYFIKTITAENVNTQKIIVQ